MVFKPLDEVSWGENWISEFSNWIDEMLVAEVFHRVWISVCLYRHFINSLCKLHVSAKGIEKMLCDPENFADGILQTAVLEVLVLVKN